MEERIDITVASNDAQRGINALSAAFQHMVATANQAQTATARLFNSMTVGLAKLELAFMSLRSVLAGFTAIIGVFSQISTEITRFQAFISAISVSVGGVQDARREFSFLMGMADRLGISITALSHNYAQMTAAAVSSGLSIKDMHTIFESFSVAARVMHLSTSDTRLMFYALTQMISKGVVSMEELRRQLGEKLPGAMNIAAKSLNTDMQTLEKAIKRGIVDSAKFLPIFAEAVRESFSAGLPNAIKALDAEINRLINTLQKMIIAFYDLGVAESFTNIIKELNRILGDVGVHDAFAKFLRDMADSVTKFLKTINKETVEKFVRDFTGALTTMVIVITRDILPIVQKLIEHFREILTGWAALKGLQIGSQLGGIGGPRGAAIGGLIGAAGAGYGMYSLLKPEEPPGWTGSTGRLGGGGGGRDVVGRIGGLPPANMLSEELAAGAPPGYMFKMPGKKKTLADVTGPSKFTESEIKEMGKAANEAEAMMQEARDLGLKFLVEEQQNKQKFRNLDLQETDDYYQAGGAMLIKNYEERNAQLIAIYEQELNTAYEHGQQLLEVDKLSHSMKLVEFGKQFSIEEIQQQQIHDYRMQQLEQFGQEELDQFGGYNLIKERMEQEHADRMHSIRLKNNDQTLAMMMAFREADYKNATATLANMTAGLAQHSKTWFEINKAAGIANVVISGVEAVMKAYAWGAKFGPWAGYAAAAVAGAFYASQLAAMRGVQYHGGGSTGGGIAPSLATTPAPPVTPVENTTTTTSSPSSAPAPQQTLVVSGLSGEGIISLVSARDIAEKIIEFQQNGGRVILES